MAVAAGGGWMRFKCASHFPSTEQAVWFRKESFCTLASFTRRFNPPNSTWDRGRIEKEGEEQGLPAGLLLRVVPRGPGASSGSRLGAGVDGKRAQRDQGGWGCFYIFRGCGQFWEEDAGPSPPRPGAESPSQAAASAGRPRARGRARGVGGASAGRGRGARGAVRAQAGWGLRSGRASESRRPGSRTTSRPRPGAVSRAD